MSKSGSMAASSRSLKSMTSNASNAAAAITSLRMERGLLERMVQERDEKISSLQKSIEVQNTHVIKLQSKIEVLGRHEKQTEARHKLQVDNMLNDQNMLKAQLELLQSEIVRIRSDPIRHVLKTSNSSEENALNDAMNKSKSMSAVEPLSTTEESASKSSMAKKIKLAFSNQGRLLQTQLYQAMNSLSLLRSQTSVMKQNYDAIVKSLQSDLNQLSDEHAKVETELLCQISALEQKNKVMQKTLQDELSSKDARIKRLEKSVRMLEQIDDESDESDDGTVDAHAPDTNALADFRNFYKNSKSRSATVPGKKEVMPKTALPYTSVPSGIYASGNSSAASTASPITIQTNQNHLTGDLPMTLPKNVFKDHSAPDLLSSRTPSRESSCTKSSGFSGSNSSRLSRESSQRAQNLLIASQRRAKELLKTAEEIKKARVVSPLNEKTDEFVEIPLTSTPPPTTITTVKSSKKDTNETAQLRAKELLKAAQKKQSQKNLSEIAKGNGNEKQSTLIDQEVDENRNPSGASNDYVNYKMSDEDDDEGILSSLM